MNLDDLPPPQLMWEGKFVRALKRGKWEYASRANNINAVVILAEYEGKVILIDQPRVPPDCRCLELPAGLVGDHDDAADEDVLVAAGRELEEETGWRADTLDLIGEFYSSPGMVSEHFALVRASGLTQVGAGGGVDSEDIEVHRVPLAELAEFVENRRNAGVGIDVRIMGLLLAGQMQAGEL